MKVGVIIKRKGSSIYSHKTFSNFCRTKILIIGYALELPSQYLLKYLSYHIQHWKKVSQNLS